MQYGKLITTICFVLFHMLSLAAHAAANDSSSMAPQSFVNDNTKVEFLLAFGTITGESPSAGFDTLITIQNTSSANLTISVSFPTSDKVCPANYYAYVEYGLVNGLNVCDAFGICYTSRRMQSQLFFLKKADKTSYQFGGYLMNTLQGTSANTWAAVSFSIWCYPCPVPTQANNALFNLTPGGLCNDTIVYQPYVVEA